MSIRFEDYVDAEGNIDWDAYHQAEVDAGEKCYRCHKFLIVETIGRTLFGKDDGEPRRRLCHDCERMDTDSSETRHDKYIRCPKCGHQSPVHDWDMCDYGEVFYEEGEHEVMCPQCEYEFTITTHVSYAYTSPPPLTPEEKEALDD
jgi:transcription elongation factor Elf1